MIHSKGHVDSMVPGTLSNAGTVTKLSLFDNDQRTAKRDAFSTVAVEQRVFLVIRYNGFNGLEMMLADVVFLVRR